MSPLVDAARPCRSPELSWHQRRIRRRACAQKEPAARRTAATSEQARVRRRQGAAAGAALAGAGSPAFAGAGAALAPPAPSVIWPSSAPTATVSPSLATISPKVPANGAGTSMVTLSVSSSTKGLVDGDSVTGLLEPAADGGFGDGFTQCRNANFSHFIFPLRHERHIWPSALSSIQKRGGEARALRGPLRGVSRGLVEEGFQLREMLDIRPVAVAARPPRGRRVAWRLWVAPIWLSTHSR